MTCVRYDLRLLLMKLGVQHIMLYTALPQHIREKLRGVYIYRAKKYRLTIGMSPLDLIADSLILLFLSLKYRILPVVSGYGLIRRDRHDVHAVDLTELLLFRESSTRHTTFLIEFIKEILEGYRRKRL